MASHDERAMISQTVHVNFLLDRMKWRKPVTTRFGTRAFIDRAASIIGFRAVRCRNSNASAQRPRNRRSAYCFVLAISKLLMPAITGVDWMSGLGRASGRR